MKTPRIPQGKRLLLEKVSHWVSHSDENVALWSDIRTLIDACPDLPAEARQRLIMHGDEACRVMLDKSNSVVQLLDISPWRVVHSAERASVGN